MSNPKAGKPVPDTSQSALRRALEDGLDLGEGADIVQGLAATEATRVSSRDAFYELSKPLVRYRELTTGDDKPHAVYCSMAKKSWLQVSEEIGNPYHGNSMKRCGAVVSQ